MSSALLTNYCKDLKVMSNYGEDNTNQSDSLKIEVWDVPRHRFEFDYMSIAIKDLSVQRQFYAFFESLERSKSSFTWRPPVIGDNIGTGFNNPSVAATSAGATSVTIDGIVEPGQPLLAAGDYLKFSNHSKVYMSMTNVTDATPVIELNTPLVTDLTTSDNVITSNVEFTLIKDPSFESGGFSRKAGDLYTSFPMRFIEKL